MKGLEESSNNIPKLEGLLLGLGVVMEEGYIDLKVEGDSKFIGIEGKLSQLKKLEMSSLINYYWSE
jgi:hypothetical protein